MIHNHFDIQGVVALATSLLLPLPTYIEVSRDAQTLECRYVRFEWAWEEGGSSRIRFSDNAISYEHQIIAYYEYERNEWLDIFRTMCDPHDKGEPEAPSKSTIPHHVLQWVRNRHALQ